MLNQYNQTETLERDHVADAPVRKVRSFVRREARFTASQRKAIADYSAEYVIPADTTPVEIISLFPQNKPLILEIGFGNGEALLTQAEKNTEFNYIGLEVHRPGVGRFLNALHEKNILQVRVCMQDAVEFIQRLPDNSLSGMQIFFPDPWPKKRHQKRRLVQKSFLNLALPKLKHAGFIHCATDWEDYALQMKEIFKAETKLKDLSPDGSGFIPRPDRAISHFEARGLRLGHNVWDLKFERCACSA